MKSFQGFGWLASFLIISACSLPIVGPNQDQPVSPDTYLVVQHAAPFDLFVAIEPIAYSDFFVEKVAADRDGDNVISRKEPMFSFANEAVQVRVKQFNAGSSCDQIQPLRRRTSRDLSANFCIQRSGERCECT